MKPGFVLKAASIILLLAFIELGSAKKSGDVTELQIEVTIGGDQYAAKGTTNNTPVILDSVYSPVLVYKPKTCEVQAQKNDGVTVHYTGRLTDGTEFDSSYGGGQPISFVLGGGLVIKGWDQGLLGMCPGEKRKLTVPPKLGYGDRALGPIPRNK